MFVADYIVIYGADLAVPVALEVRVRRRHAHKLADHAHLQTTNSTCVKTIKQW